MKKKILYLGDGSLKFANQVQLLDKSAFLVNNKNIIKFKLGEKSGYSSLADLSDIGNTPEFTNLLDSADQIYFIESPSVSNVNVYNLDPSNLIEIYLENYNYSTNKVVGLKNFCLRKFKEFNELKIDRISNIWIVGCSVTYGIGISKNDRYGSIIEKELGVTAQYIAVPGCSNMWIADQILEADIRENDIIFWGLTNAQRTYFRTKDNVLHLSVGNNINSIKLKEIFDIDRLNDYNILYQNINSIIKVMKYANNIGAKLFMQQVIPNPILSPFLNGLENYSPSLGHYQPYIDLGFDDMHPGPKQHKIFAKNFIDMYNSK